MCYDVYGDRITDESIEISYTGKNTGTASTNAGRLKRASSIFAVISLIITALLAIALVAVAVLGIAAALNGDIMHWLLNEWGEMAGADQYPVSWSTETDVYLNLFAAGMILITMIFIFLYAYKLFSNISTSHTPFDMENAKILKKISYVMLILAIPVSIINAILMAVFASGSSGMTEMNNLIFVLVAILFYFLALIFEYGASLQKESDETL